MVKLAKVRRATRPSMSWKRAAAHRINAGEDQCCAIRPGQGYDGPRGAGSRLVPYMMTAYGNQAAQDADITNRQPGAMERIARVFTAELLASRKDLAEPDRRTRVFMSACSAPAH